MGLKGWLGCLGLGDPIEGLLDDLEHAVLPASRVTAAESLPGAMRRVSPGMPYNDSDEHVSIVNPGRALPALTRALKDTHPEVRQAACNALRELGLRSSVKDLLPLLDFEQPMTVRVSALQVTGEFLNREAMVRLSELALHEAPDSPLIEALLSVFWHLLDDARPDRPITDTVKMGYIFHREIGDALDRLAPRLRSNSHHTLLSGCREHLQLIRKAEEQDQARRATQRAGRRAEPQKQ